MNSIIIHGRLTKDPDTKFYNNDKAVTNISVAVNRSYKDDKGNTPVDFFVCTAFNKTAETIEKYFNKGDGIIVRGEMQSRKFTDKDGNNRIAWSIKISEFDFPMGKKSGEKPPLGQDGAEDFVPVDESANDEDLPF